jgi:hypothetical protein
MSCLVRQHALVCAFLMYTSSCVDFPLLAWCISWLVLLLPCMQHDLLHELERVFHHGLRLHDLLQDSLGWFPGVKRW